MPIPETADFEDALSKIVLTTNKPNEGECAALLPTFPAVDEAGKVTQDQFWLLYPNNTRLSFEGLCKRIAKELNLSRHSIQIEFVLFALAFACMLSTEAVARVAGLNQILNLVCDGDVNLYFILAAEIPDNLQYEIPPFRFGRLRCDKLRYQCEKAESDFYQRYQDRLRESWAVSRAAKRVRVLDFPRIWALIFGRPEFGRTGVKWQVKAWECLVTDYFSMQNRKLFEDFWTEIVSAQDALLSLGGPFSDPRPFTSVIHHEQVAVFLNIGQKKAGFVAPAGCGPVSLDFANAHKRVPELIRELRESYKFDHFDDSALHSSIKLFASFVARARRHQIGGHSDEALLHFVIALEMIFGEKQTIQNSVARRVAVLTFIGAKRSFEQQKLWIDNVYNIRSRYVHAGTLLTDDGILDELYASCEKVFRCLMKLQAAYPLSSDRGEERLKSWLSHLDYLAAGFAAKKIIDDQELKDAFIT